MNNLNGNIDGNVRMKIKTKIVGLKHHDVSSSLQLILLKNKITLIPEPENTFDKFAIKCQSSNIFFGYIEKKMSKQVSDFLKLNNDYEVNVISFDEFKVNVELIFDIDYSYTINNLNFFKDENSPCIYAIRFRLNQNDYKYVGQTQNVYKRLKNHYRSLENNSHHNKLLQEGWIKNYKSFANYILERFSLDLNPFELQMSLRESEIDYIENPSPGEIIANILPGNYEETKDSKEYIKNKIKIVFNFMKIDRDNIQKQKNEIGQKMIDLGIVKGDAVKASNVLSNINKTQRGYGSMLYRLTTEADVNTFHPQFESLFCSMKDLDAKIKKISQKRSFLNNWFNGTIVDNYLSTNYKTLKRRKRKRKKGEVMTDEEIHRVEEILKEYNVYL